MSSILKYNTTLNNHTVLPTWLTFSNLVCLKCVQLLKVLVPKHLEKRKLRKLFFMPFTSFRNCPFNNEQRLKHCNCFFASSWEMNNKIRLLFFQRHIEIYIFLSINCSIRGFLFLKKIPLDLEYTPLHLLTKTHWKHKMQDIISILFIYRMDLAT